MTKAEVVKLIYPERRAFDGRRFTQNTPILPDVWIAYGTSGPGQEQELLLTPNLHSSIPQLVTELRVQLQHEVDNDLRTTPGHERRASAARRQESAQPFVGYIESHVLAELTFEQLLRALLPLSLWWQEGVEPGGSVAVVEFLDQLLSSSGDTIVQAMQTPTGYVADHREHGIRPDMLDMVRIAGGILTDDPKRKTRPQPPAEPSPRALRASIRAVRNLVARHDGMRRRQPQGPAPLFSVSCNRTAETAVTVSRLAIKADAAIRLFKLSCRDLAWAVIDSGIDAAHPAFADWSGAGGSRVIETYDFSRLQPFLRWVNRPGDKKIPPDLIPKFESLKNAEDIVEDLNRRLLFGQRVEWDRLLPILKIDSSAADAPKNQHGTHVAGILGADWRKPDAATPAPPGYQPPDAEVLGVCPDIRLYDLRVINNEGEGTEFAILAALQFVRNLNQSRDRPVIHGVNLSFSLQHNVQSYACGSTPVCQECDRLWNSGVVVVTAAGNRGFLRDEDLFETYRAMTITDPGNADAVITVGSTHRIEPHRYGVSYFSSRGPTGDGRRKPDLVAPGEKIRSVVPGNGAVEMDGTSMAAPHVSGAAALLMARYQELIGRPTRIKQILCSTATDLGREPSFQGAGMLDVLRALQSI